ncbi:hypothetical protein ACFRAQ_34615 [Nocardia sp. NPDC056611]|uniref:hypothetical protein n=1 Tax=Nocardia sp. NPDC056611 TaxID=3345877 RepID=UPI00366DFECA
MAVERAPYFNGSLLRHAPAGMLQLNGLEWRDNKPFRSSLRVVGKYETSKTAVVELADSNGHKYPMFVADLVKMLQNPNLGIGITEGAPLAFVGSWIVCRRGSAYGIRYAG